VQACNEKNAMNKGKNNLPKKETRASTNHHLTMSVNALKESVKHEKYLPKLRKCAYTINMPKYTLNLSDGKWP
jgi:hypothetical protein